MDKIVLKNMAFYGYHGNLESEQAQGQRFFVDVEITTDLTKAGQSDLLEDSINYVEVYEGNPEQRDTSYHQGITWPWLLGLYYDALKNKLKSTKDKEKIEETNLKLDKFVKKVDKTFAKEMNENGCIGSIAEIYDSAKPQLPKGAFAQCWSVGAIFRIILKK